MKSLRVHPCASPIRRRLNIEESNFSCVETRNYSLSATGIRSLDRTAFS